MNATAPERITRYSRVMDILDAGGHIRSEQSADLVGPCLLYLVDATGAELQAWQTALSKAALKCCLVDRTTHTGKVVERWTLDVQERIASQPQQTRHAPSCEGSLPAAGTVPGSM